MGKESSPIGFKSAEDTAKHWAGSEIVCSKADGADYISIGAYVSWLNKALDADGRPIVVATTADNLSWLIILGYIIGFGSAGEIYVTTEGKDNNH